MVVHTLLSNAFKNPTNFVVVQLLVYTLGKWDTYRLTAELKQGLKVPNISHCLVDTIEYYRVETQVLARL